MKPHKLLDSKTKLFRAKHEEGRLERERKQMNRMQAEMTANWNSVYGLVNEKKEQQTFFDFKTILTENGFAKIYGEPVYYRETENQFYAIRIAGHLMFHGFIDFIPPAKGGVFKLKHKERFIAKRKLNLTDSVVINDAVLMDGILVEFHDAEKK